MTDQLRNNLNSVREQIAIAANKVGRAGSEIQLVAVTKYVDFETTQALFELGCTDLGESRPQQLWPKAERLPQANWHLIGHLQRNKVKKTLPAAGLIHSVDSLRLLREIEQESQRIKKTSRVLLEVNVSQDANKHGFSADQLLETVPAVTALKNVEVVGLMAMSSRGANEKSAAAEFRRLRELRDSLQAELPTNVQLTELSMGMSGDFEAAIAEGSTMVRIGSALFKGV